MGSHSGENLRPLLSSGGHDSGVTVCRYRQVMPDDELVVYDARTLRRVPNTTLSLYHPFLLHCVSAYPSSVLVLSQVRSSLAMIANCMAACAFSATYMLVVPTEDRKRALCVRIVPRKSTTMFKKLNSKL